MKYLLLLTTLILFAASCSSDSKAELVLADSHSTFHIEGMTCAEMCAKRIEDKIARTVGVKNCTVDFENKIASLNYNSQVIEIEAIVLMVEEMSEEKYTVSDLKTEEITNSQNNIKSSSENETRQILSTPSFEIPNLLDYLRSII